MADTSRSIEDILAALAQQRPAASAAPAPQPTPPAGAAYPPPPAPTAGAQYSMPPGMSYPPASYAPGAYPTGSYAPPNTYAPPAAAQPAAGSVDLSSIKPVSSGTVSIEDAIKHAKAIAAKKGVVPYDRSAASYNDTASSGGYGRNRSSRSRSPQPRRDAYRDNYSAYRDERRDGQRDYGRERSYSPGPRGRAFSPRGSSGNARDRSPLRGNDDSEIIEIESSLVGLIIGRQGENLRRVESETGCRVQFLTPPGDSTPYRQCKITGPRSRRADAKAAINRIIDDSGMGAIARAGLDKGGNDARNMRDSEDSTQIMVPDRTVGLIIGRGGETIRDLQERSGCHINIVGESKSVNGLRPVNLIGHPDCTQKAKNLIMEIVDSDTRNAAAGSSGSGNRSKPESRDQGNEKINDSIYVPSEAVGMIIGKGGETIRDMQNMTGCKINVSQSSGPGEVEREIGLVGTRDAINKAKRAIEDKVETVMQRVRNGSSGGRNNRQRNDEYDRSQSSNYNRSDNSAPAAAPPAGGAAAVSNAADPYAPYGGYQNYVALWYQALAAQGGAVPGQAPDASKPPAP